MEDDAEREPAPIHKLKKRKKRSKTKTNTPVVKKRRLITENTSSSSLVSITAKIYENEKNEEEEKEEEEKDIRLIYFENMIDFTPTLPFNSFMSVDLNQNVDMKKFIKTCYPYTFNALYNIIFCSYKDVLIRYQSHNNNDINTMDIIGWDIINSHCSVETIVSKLSQSDITLSLPLIFSKDIDGGDGNQNKENCRRWRNIIWEQWTMPNTIQWFIFTIFPLINKKIPNMSKIKLAALIYQNSYSEFYKHIFACIDNNNNDDEDDDDIDNNYVETYEYPIGLMSNSITTSTISSVKKDGLILIIEKTGKWGNPVGAYLCYDITKKTQKQLINGIIPQISLYEGTVSKLYYISPFGCKKMTEININWVKENKTCVYIFIPIAISNVINTNNQQHNGLERKNIKKFDNMINFIIYLEKHGCFPRKYMTDLNQHMFDHKPDYCTLTPSASTFNNNNNNHLQHQSLEKPINFKNYSDDDDYHHKYTLSPNNDECINMHYNSLLWNYGNCSQIEGEMINNLLITTLQQIGYTKNSVNVITGVHKGGKREQETVFKNISILSLLKYLTLWPSIGKFDFILTNHRVFLEERSTTSNQKDNINNNTNINSLSSSSSLIKKYVYDGYGSVAVPLNPHYMKFKNEHIMLTSEWFYKCIQQQHDNDDNTINNINCNDDNWLLTLSSPSSLRLIQNLSSITKITSIEEEFHSFHWFIKMLIIFFDNDNRAYLFSNFYTEQEEKGEENVQHVHNNSYWNNFEEENEYCYTFDNKKRKKHNRFHRQEYISSKRHNGRHKSTIKLLTISEKFLFITIFKIICERLTFTTTSVTSTNNNDNTISNNTPLLTKLGSKLLKHPHLTHPFFIQLGFYIVSKHLNNSIRGCWFPNTPNTLMKLYNRQYQDGIQPKERIFLLAIDNLDGDNMYWILKFNWEYNSEMSRVYPCKTRVFLLYTSKNPSSKKIKEMNIYYLETKILPYVIFFIWPNLFE